MIKLKIAIASLLTLSAVTVALSGASADEADHTTYTGSIKAGLNVADGNSRQTDYFLEAKGTADYGDFGIIEGRAYTFETETSGTRTVKNHGVDAKYKRILSEDLFYGVGASYFSDEIANLKLRYTVGPFVGYKVLEDEKQKLNIEVGAVYLIEDFSNTGDFSDTENVSGRWFLNYERKLFNDVVSFFHNHELLTSLKDAEDFIATGATGLKFPVAKSLTGSVEHRFSFDNTPSAGKERLDNYYIFTIGYEF